MLKLNEKTKRNIERATGITVSKISHSSVEEIDALIEKKMGRKLNVTVPQSEYLRNTGRGSIYIWLSRVMNFENLQRKLLKG